MSTKQLGPVFDSTGRLMAAVAQNTLERVHLQKKGTRSACRYSARPSRRLRLASMQGFFDTPTELRCVECQRAYDACCAAIAKAGGTP